MRLPDLLEVRAEGNACLVLEGFQESQDCFLRGDGVMRGHEHTGRADTDQRPQMRGLR